MISVKRYARGALHRLIAWYVDRSGGAVHSRPYERRQRYIVAMGNGEYIRWAALVQHRPRKSQVLPLHERMQGRLWKSR